MFPRPGAIGLAEEPAIETIGEIIPRIVETLFKQNLGRVVYVRRRHTSIRTHGHHTRAAAAARPAPSGESVTRGRSCAQRHGRAAGVVGAARRTAGDTEMGTFSEVSPQIIVVTQRDNR